MRGSCPMWASCRIPWPHVALEKPVCSPFARACDDPRVDGGPLEVRHNARAAGVAELPRHFHHGGNCFPLRFHAGLIIFPPGVRIRAKLQVQLRGPMSGRNSKPTPRKPRSSNALRYLYFSPRRSVFLPLPFPFWLWRHFDQKRTTEQIDEAVIKITERGTSCPSRR